MFFDLFSFIFAPLQSLFSWFLGLWWLWLFIALLYVGFCLWMAYIQEYYKRVTNSWIILELKIPREIKNTPRAMEQIYATLHSIRNSASVPIRGRDRKRSIPAWTNTAL